VERAVAAGADEVLHKPISWTTTQEVVRRYLSLGHMLNPFDRLVANNLFDSQSSWSSQPQASALPNHRIRSRQHVRRNRQADLLSRLQIDDELKLSRLFDSYISRLSPF
jgi:hypothetical protein